jgi:hypothetical protein
MDQWVNRFGMGSLRALVSWWFIVFQSQAVQVGDEMKNEFERPCLRGFVDIRVFQDGEELFRLGDHAIPMLMKNGGAPTFRSARAELKLSATTGNHR